MLVQLQAGEKEQDFASAPIQVSISVQLWRLPGCHEFLAALGKAASSAASCTSDGNAPLPSCPLVKLASGASVFP